MSSSAISPSRQENFPEWYQQVVNAAELAETSPVRGCMIIKPWGYAIWENLQRELDERLKATGHVNAYFPLLIPLNLMEKEAAHIDGFAKECAVVTHHCLKSDGQGGLVPDGELEEPYIIRPTSETIIGMAYAKWIQSHRDLPLLINQWANVMRWEMRTRLFLRTSEFLWQEGHTAHAKSQEAMEEAMMILHLYADFVEGVLAMPVIRGEKTINERFPGAVNTYTIEAMMQDCKALQAGTSHFLGQNFSKTYDIQFTNAEGQIEHVWTTSWGVSTRLIGGLIMTHSDDDGLVLPPALAPHQVVILPIYRNEEERNTVLAYCEQLQKSLAAKYFQGSGIRVHIDKRDLRGGDKNWQWIKKGVPIRLEIGMRDIAADSVFMARRDKSLKEKQTIKSGQLTETIEQLLDEIQQGLYQRAKAYQSAHTYEIDSLEKFEAFFNETNDDKIQGGFVSCYAVDDPKIEAFIKPLKVSMRCIPLAQDKKIGKCIFTGTEVDKKIIFAKAY